MQKYKIIAIGTALLLLLSGCGEGKSKSDEETDKTSKEPPARKIVEAKTEYSSDYTSASDLDTTFDEAVPFLSVIGNVVSISTKDITVEFGGKEYTFTINDETKTYGGKVGISDVVTVTYKVPDYNQDSTAKIITVLSEDGTADIVTETSVESSSFVEGIGDVTKNISENTVFTGEITEEIPPETSFVKVLTTTEATELTTTTQDNSEIISTLWNNISICEQQIEIYKWGIDEYNKSISEFEKLKSKYEKELKNAKIELDNAEKKWVYVFKDGGFQQVPDEGAISDAQEYVDFYEGLISECDAEIEEALLQNSKCELEIDALESEIIIYRAEIAELS